MAKNESSPSGISLDSIAELFSTLLKNHQAPANQTTTFESTAGSINIKLTASNYGIWAPVMEMYIGGKGRLDHIVGQSTPPEPTEPSYSRWQQTDLAVKSWIINSMDPTLVALFVRYPTARNMWDAIATTYYDGADKMRLYELRRQACRIRQGDDSLENFYGTLQGIWREMDFRRPNPMECAKDIERHRNILEEERVYQFLDGINDVFDPVKRDIINTSPLPTTEAAYNLIRREASRASVMKDSAAMTIVDSGVGLATKSRSDHRPGSSFRSENSKSVDRGTPQKCSHCGGKHSRDTCFQLHGYPDWWHELQQRKGGRRSSTGTAKLTTTSDKGGSNLAGNDNDATGPTEAATVGIARGTVNDGGKQGPLTIFPSQGERRRRDEEENPGRETEADERERGHPNGLKEAGQISGSQQIAHPNKWALLSDGPDPVCPGLGLLVAPDGPSNFGPPTSSPLQQVSSTGHVFSAGRRPPKSDAWILDSGCTDHMTFSARDIYLPHTPDKKLILNANGIAYPVVGGGSAKITSTLSLDKVLLVPSLSHKLLSISQVTKALNCVVLMFSRFCLIQDIRTKEIIGRGIEKGGLYHVDEVSQTGTANFVGGSTEQQLWLWHRRLGHPSIGYLKQLFPKLCVKTSTLQCQTCILAKSHRTHFPTSTHKTTLPFTLIHSDVWGPAPVTSIGSHRWFIIFVDNCTRMTWVYFLKNKSEVSAVFTAFYAMIEHQFLTKIQILRSDNGGEFVNQTLKQFFTAKGIIHETTCSYSPQQNGVAERKN